MVEKEISHDEREKLIEEIAEGDRFSHAVYGCFNNNGHLVQTTKGPSITIKSLFLREQAYRAAFENETDGPEFKARVLVNRTEQGEGFVVLTYNDRQYDRRNSSHVDYALVIPSEATDRIMPVIEYDPAIPLDVFRRVFPTYDRSNGALIIDPKQPSVMILPLQDKAQ